MAFENTCIDNVFLIEYRFHLPPCSLPELAIDCEDTIADEVLPDAMETFALAIRIDVAQKRFDVVRISRENESPRNTACELSGQTWMYQFR